VARRADGSRPGRRGDRGAQSAGLGALKPGAVAVVVLSWNGREDTLECLRSLERVEAPGLLTIVVDNGSTDGTSEAVHEAFPDTELVRTETNLGFAEGNNVGMRRALELGAAYVLVLNNDVEVDPAFVRALVEEAERRPDAGALCSKILYADPPDLIWFAGASFDPRSGYNGRQRGYRERDDGRFDELVETDRACGAAMLVPREVLEKIGRALGLRLSSLLAQDERDVWQEGFDAGVRAAQRALDRLPSQLQDQATNREDGSE